MTNKLRLIVDNQSDLDRLIQRTKMMPYPKLTEQDRQLHRQLPALHHRQREAIRFAHIHYRR